MNRFIAYIVILISITSCIKDKPSGEDLAVGDMIPEFSVIMDDGSEMTGSQLSQGVSMIVFFTTSCPDCRKALPEIQKIYDEYLHEGVSFALISREDPSESVAQYWSENGFTIPYSAQSDRKIYEMFAKTRVPRVYICRHGVIKTIFTDSPIPAYNDLKAGIEGALYKY